MSRSDMIGSKSWGPRFVEPSRYYGLPFAACVCLLTVILLSRAGWGQMVNPAIDVPNQPFSYYSEPTDEIGVMDAPTGTLISPEGFYYTGYGELMFFTGRFRTPIMQRTKTLLRGYLPVVQYDVVRDGILYHFTAFAATLDGEPSGTLVDFIRVEVRNEDSRPRSAWISSGMRYEGNINTRADHADNRYTRPYAAQYPGDSRQMGVKFNPNWEYSSEKNTIQRDRQIVYYFPDRPHTIRYLLKDKLDKTGELKPRVLNILPTSPVGIVEYQLALKPGEQVTLDWKLPVVPIAQGSDDVAKIHSASFDKYLSHTVNFWESVLKSGIDIRVPEEKVTNAFKASLIYDLIARNKIGDDYIQSVNDFQYHGFWLRDGSFIARMYDISGYHTYARQVLDFFARWQQPDGNFVSQGGQYDGIGQVLWAYGQHYKITQDREFAERIFPAVAKAAAWIQRARGSDPLHIMPVTTPGDNENVTGHVTGHNFWALAGLENAVFLADATGHTVEAKELRREYQDYRSAFVRVLEHVTQKTGGYIPPGLDGQHGQDWDNMLAVYPAVTLPPHGRMVTATLNSTRAKYQEGIMTYSDGEYLHGYLGFSNIETEIVRGDQQLAIKDLYAELVHSSSTHAGFESDIRPWGDRDFGSNLSPHGWYAARLRIGLRNMLILDEGAELHLLSAVSPEWIQPGKEVSVSNAPTDFGMVDLSLKSLSETQARIAIVASFVSTPGRIILHLPWFMETTSVVCDGTKLTIINNEVAVPITAKNIQIQWKKRPGTEPMSYLHSVAQYKVEYAKRYRAALQAGLQ